jgi:transcriptional regulator with XRE-family HTH domain
VHRNIKLLEHFGRRVRTLREQAGLSQEELAKRASLDRTYVSGVERGRRNPSLTSIGLIASGLGVSFADLFMDHGT